MGHPKRIVRIELLVMLALSVNVGGQESGAAITIGSRAFAQTQDGNVTTRITRWTRTRLESAKKQWAQDQQRFSECTQKLGQMKAGSKRRLSYHQQGHFLETCMRDQR